MSSELNDIEAPKKLGSGGLSIAGLILAILFAPVGFVLSIIALIKKDGRNKVLSIIGLVLSVINFIAALILALILLGAIIPQFTKYNEMSNIAKDIQMAKTISTAFEVAAADPNVITDSSFNPYYDDYRDIRDIPDCAFRDAVEIMLKFSLDDAIGKLQSKHSDDATILYKHEGGTFTIMITGTDITGKKDYTEDNYIIVY